MNYEPFTDEHLLKAVTQLGGGRIAVIGDVILDVYVFGEVDRISQEAPVPIVRKTSTEYRLGGAGAVAATAASLGSRVSLFGISGDDKDSERVSRLVSQLGVEDRMMVIHGRSTTVKTRLLGNASHRHPQQIARIDSEMTSFLSRFDEQIMLSALLKDMHEFSCMVLSDYAKGCLSAPAVVELIERAASENVPVLVDPRADRSFWAAYAGCDTIKPNRFEAEKFSDRRISSTDDAFEAAKQIAEHLKSKSAVITLDRDGVVIACNHVRTHIPCREKIIYDVTGAGDAFMAAFASAFACGMDRNLAAAIGNLAGAVEVSRLGCVPVRRQDLADELRCTASGVLSSSKIVGLDALKSQLSIHRSRGRKIVFTNGCFDILHFGHVQCLQHAKSEGDVLVVGLNSDASVRRLKGEGRPIVPEGDRAAVLASMSCVDYVVLFDQDTPLNLVSSIPIDVLVKGGDYADKEIVGAGDVIRNGGRISLSTLVPWRSTSKLAERLASTTQVSDESYQA